MAAAYKQFLASPSSSLLADNASLHYVTTLTSFVGATEIIKHLNTLQKQVKKKKEDVISLIDGQNVIAVEVDTCIEFVTSGGAYLPGLDDNFLSDREAFLPIMHIVSFDDDGKIVQIRQQWDQGSLLKQLEIIGKSGRNWPIRDGKEQVRLIESCVKSSGFTAPAQGQAPAQSSNGHSKNRNSSTNIMRDPHASLHLFGSREEAENAEPAGVVSPYAGSKPKQRAFTDILADEPQHWDDHQRRSMSPHKMNAGKNVQPIRIFEGQQHPEDDSEDDEKPERYIRAHPAKYQHFALADGSEESEGTQASQVSATKPAAKAPRPKSKHDSTWSFDDFTTPVKSKPGRGQGTNPDARNWDAGEISEPVKAPVGKARRDAETHFELQDDGELPPEERRIAIRTRGAVRNENAKNNVFEREAEDPSNRPLGNITNVSKDRGKDFDPHFTMTDDHPAPAAERQPVAEHRQKAVKTMNANWSLTDESPAAQKENKPQAGKSPQPDSKIHIAGDGMGGKKGAQRDFLYGGEDPTGSKIHIAGDGMGGRQGTRRDFLFGGDDEPEPPKPISRKGGAQGAQRTNFWNQ
ncbi:hypothetical protein GGI42DRAFT_9150 [Trichoderma sp. SZMC 28013]